MDAHPTAKPSEAPPCGRARELGFWMSTALVVGNTVGMGIFLLPASLAPYGFNALIGWAVTVAGMTAIALVFAALARTFPQADGPHAYLRATLGEWIAFVALWCYWISLWATNAALAVGVVGYLAVVVPPTSMIPPLAIALALVWLCVGANLFGARAGGGVQLVTTALKLVPLVALILLGLWLLGTHPSAYTEHLPSAPITGGAILAASTTSLYAMLGIESAAIPAGRVKDAARVIPRATLAGTLLIATIYVAVSAAAILLVPEEQLGASTAPLADLLGRFSLAGAERWLAAFVVVSGLGALNGWTLLTGELTRTMAANGLLPRWLSAQNSRGAPTAALVATAVLATAMLAMNYTKSLVAGFTFLTLVITAANLPLYLCCSLALVVLWKRGVDGASRALLGAVGVAYTSFAFFGMGREPFLWSLALCAAGIPLFALLRRVPRPV